MVFTMILDAPIEDELKVSYIDYSMSVIVGRALPNAFDGLKPVQRRILYAMHTLGLTHGKHFQKCAKIVGEVLGKYHPHGDSAIYDAMVRLAQIFSMRYQLIDGQGNFGSIDGDNAAAMRYTEARMTKISELMLADIDKKTVDTIPNFDNTIDEPIVLPTKIPNLLINGSMGIAVGMATNIPPHNLGEVVEGILLLLDDENADDQKLFEIVKGPDFPTGGIICGRSGIKKAYLTGKGTIVIRAKVEIDENKIIVTELPYIVNKSDLVEYISRLADDNVIQGISSVLDYSNKEGIYIEIKLKKGAIAEVVLNHLFAKTHLQTTFGINNVAIINNVPKLFTLRDMFVEFISFRKRIVTKRSKFLLDKATERLEVVNGLIIAGNNIDEVVELLRAANDVESAKRSLVEKFMLTELQCSAILNMRLQSLIRIEKDKLLKEKGELETEITSLNLILNDPLRLKEVIRSELAEVRDQFSDPRRTAIENVEIDIPEEELIEDEAVVVMLTQRSYVKRIALEEYKLQNRGGKGVIAAITKDEDILKQIIVCNSKDYLLVFTNKGNVFWLKAYHVPELGRYASGKPIVNLLKLEEGEEPATIIATSNLVEESYLMMVTRKGAIKKVSSLHFVKPRSSGKRAITLRDGDSLCDVVSAKDDQSIMIASANGKAIRFEVKDIRVMGRGAMGVRGMRLRKGDSVMSFCIVDRPYIMAVTENGYGKRTLNTAYRIQGRGGKGITNIITCERNGRVVATFAVDDEQQLLLVSSSNKAIRIRVSKLNVIGRMTKGVRLMNLDEKETVAGASVIDSEYADSVSAEEVQVVEQAVEEKVAPEDDSEGQEDEEISPAEELEEDSPDEEFEDAPEDGSESPSVDEED